MDPTCQRSVKMFELSNRFAVSACLYFALTSIVASSCLPNLVTAQSGIHKCTDAEGGIVYSELPCVLQESVEPEAAEPDEEAEFAEPVFTESVRAEQESPSNEIPEEGSDAETNRTACKKRYRDAIDAIDAEIGREYSPDKAEHYKSRLLALTRQLRQC